MGCRVQDRMQGVAVGQRLAGAAGQAQWARNLPEPPTGPRIGQPVDTVPCRLRAGIPPTENRTDAQIVQEDTAETTWPPKRGMKPSKLVTDTGAWLGMPGLACTLAWINSHGPDQVSRAVSAAPAPGPHARVRAGPAPEWGGVSVHFEDCRPHCSKGHQLKLQPLPALLRPALLPPSNYPDLWAFKRMRALVPRWQGAAECDWHFAPLVIPT